MAKPISIKGLRQRVYRLVRCRTFEELATLLRTPSLKLLAIADNPKYHEFFVPKKNGGQRHIEDPEPTLKRIQRKLNDYLQAVYYFHRTEAAYGFLTTPVGDPSPRNILTNAMNHIGCKWMLNVDMKDFFHLVTQPRVIEIFEAPILDFDIEIATVLASLCCHKGRLPMGAPTSPVLSNLASIPLDQDLQDFANKKGWKYTRYADDISFSSTTPINEGHIKEVIKWIEIYDYKLNPTKIKLFGPEDEKTVTGLLIEEKEVGIPEDYHEALGQSITQLSQVVDAKFYMPSGRYQPSAWVDELQQHVEGKMAFARHILGEDDEQVIQLEMQLEEALEPPKEYGPVSWLDFGYEFFK